MSKNIEILGNPQNQKLILDWQLDCNNYVNVI